MLQLKRLASLGLAAVLLTGCGLKAPAVPATATAEDRQRAEACHTRAIAEAAERVPYVDTSKARSPKDWAWWEWALSPLIVAGELSKVPVAIALAPVLVPLAIKSVRDRRQGVHRQMYETCLAPEPPATAEAAGEETPR